MGLTSGGLAAQGAEASHGGDFIDAHVHVWTSDTNKYPLAEGYSKESMQPASFTPEDLFAQSRPCGVNRIVLIQMNFYEDDNSYMLDMVEKYPDVFRAVGIVNEKRKDLRETILKQIKQGVRGYRLYADKKNCLDWENSAAMTQMWEIGAETGVNMCLLSNPDALPVIDRLCKKFPKTPVVIDHMSRIGMTGTVDQSEVKDLCKLAEHEHVTVKTSAFYALGKKEVPYKDLVPLIRQLFDAFGPQRLMWASDCPFQVENGHTYAASIELIKDHLDFASQEERSWILRDTAQKVFYW